MICLRTLHKWEGTDKLFALPYPGVLRIEGDAMTLLVDLPWDEPRKKKLMEYLNQEWKFPALGVKVEDLAGRSDDIWEWEAWAGRSKPGDPVNRHVLEGLAVGDILCALRFEQGEKERREAESSMVGFGADWFLESTCGGKPPFRVGYNYAGKRFSAWKGLDLFPLENVASYILDKTVEKFLKSQMRS